MWSLINCLLLDNPWQVMWLTVSINSTCFKSIEQQKFFDLVQSEFIHVLIDNLNYCTIPEEVKYRIRTQTQCQIMLQCSWSYIVTWHIWRCVYTVTCPYMVTYPYAHIRSHAHIRSATSPVASKRERIPICQSECTVPPSQPGRRDRAVLVL